MYLSIITPVVRWEVEAGESLRICIKLALHIKQWTEESETISQTERRQGWHPRLPAFWPPHTPSPCLWCTYCPQIPKDNFKSFKTKESLSKLTLSEARIRKEAMTCSAVSVSAVSLVMKSMKDWKVTVPCPLGSTRVIIRANSASPWDKVM